jgi:cation:H+ antiporter
LSNINGYPFFLLLPLFLGLNGYYSRIEGLLLIIVGGFFYYSVFKNDVNVAVTLESDNKNKYKNILMLLLSMALLLVGSSFTVSSATSMANILSISPILIGMLIVGLGTTMPELFYSLKSVQKGEDDLAVGDILGTVLADATILIGVLAFIHPFHFPVKIVYFTGIFMLIASIILLTFMYTGQKITKKEGYILLIFWMVYVLTEAIINI